MGGNRGIEGREKKSEDEEEGGAWRKGPNIFGRDQHFVENTQVVKELSEHLGARMNTKCA